MKYIIQESDDQFFTIQTKEMGEVWVASDGKRSVIANTEQDAVEFFESIPSPVKDEVVEEFPQPLHRGPIGAPIENFKSGNFDLFEGTSFAGKKQPH